MSRTPAGTMVGAPAAEPPLGLWERFDPRRFVRGERAVEGPVELSHRRIFILPNRRGLGFAVLLAIQFLIAINYGNNLAFMLTFLLFSLALVTTLHTFRNLAGLRISPGRVAPVFDGEQAWFEIAIENPSRLPRLGVSARLKGQDHAAEFEVPGASVVSIKLAAQTQGRGWLTMATVTLGTSYPLGIFTAWSPLNLHQRALVYPRPAPEGSDLPMASCSSDGTARVSVRADDDFLGFRGYRSGDPLKRIYWKGLAKGQSMQIKQYGGYEGADIELDWQRTPGTDVESRLSLLCRWVLDAERSGTPYRLTLPGRSLPRGLGDAHRRRCLEALALFGR